MFRKLEFLTRVFNIFDYYREQLVSKKANADDVKRLGMKPITLIFRFPTSLKNLGG